MRDVKTILNDYWKGTPEVRLNLFLFHRELRCAFNAIEKNEEAMPNRIRRITQPFGPLIRGYRSAG
jgi:hypothetical protein